MERRAPHALPVGLGVKVDTIHSGRELLLCNKIVYLPSGIRHSAVRIRRTSPYPLIKNVPICSYMIVATDQCFSQKPLVLGGPYVFF